MPRWTIRLGHYGDSRRPEFEQPNEHQFLIILTTASCPLFLGVTHMIDMNQHGLNTHSNKSDQS